MKLSSSARFGALLLLLCLVPVARGADAVAAPAVVPDPELATKLQDAIEVGDNARLLELAKPYAGAPGSPLPAGLNTRTCSLIGIALAFTQPARAFDYFAFARQGDEYSRASFWLGEVLLFQGMAGTAIRVTSEMEAFKPRNPLAIAYLRGRVALHLSEQLPVTAPRHAELRQLAYNFLQACTDPRQQEQAGFDPRFLTLAMDWQLGRADLPGYADACEQIRRFRPRNLGNLRRLLVLRLPELSGAHAALLADAAAQLPADEFQRWQARAEEAKLMPPGPELGALLLRYADLAESKTPGAADLLPGYTFLLWRALDALPETDPRRPAVVARFAQRVMGLQVALAVRGLELVDRERAAGRTVPLGEGVELRLCLAAHDERRALPLAQAAFAAHQDDYWWIRTYWPVFAEGPEPLQRQAADALVRLQPQDRFAALAASRAYANGAAALAKADALFAGTPVYGTSASDWDRYRDRLKQQGASSDFLDGTKTGADTAEKKFTATLERWRLAQPHDPAIAEKIALLRIEQANAATNAKTVDAALAAVNDAIFLGSLHAGIASSRAKLKTAAAAYQLQAENERKALALVKAREKAAAAEERQREQERDEISQQSKNKIADRQAYVDGLMAQVAALERRQRTQIMNAETRAAVRHDLDKATDITGNFCWICHGLGLSTENAGRSYSRCSICNGSGKHNQSGAGLSAGF